MKTFNCTIVQGKQIASGASDRYGEEGTIAPQIPLFKAYALNNGMCLPVDLDEIFHGTINCVHGTNWTPTDQALFFKDIKWFEGYRKVGNGEEFCIKEENFFLIPINIEFESISYSAYIYLPDPTTKESPENNEYIRFEVLCEFVPNVAYGKTAKIMVDPKYINY